MGILEILTIIFVVCKIAGLGAIATWSWVGVFTPLIISGCIYLSIILFPLIAGTIAWFKAK